MLLCVGEDIFSPVIVLCGAIVLYMCELMGLVEEFAFFLSMSSPFKAQILKLLRDQQASSEKRKLLDSSGFVHKEVKVQMLWEFAENHLR